VSEPNYELTYVEIDVDYCSLTYGVAPCTASIPGTGTAKCFNTRASCQDLGNFTNIPVTLRFAVASSFRPLDIEVEAANIESVSYSPTIISLGENLGQRSSLTVTFKDQRHSDTGPAGDKYLADRDYNPYEQGTYWGKFRTRQQFLRGRPLRLIQGTVGQTLAEMDTRHFIVESFDGPGLDGMFTITAKDVLKLADADRAQAPLLSQGSLTADINSAVTAAVLAPVGIGNSSYPASGYLNIGGKEIVAFTRSGDNLTITRAQFGTEATDHKAGDRCQVCLIYDAEDPADVIADLFENYASIPSSAIPLASWQAETAAYYRRLVSACIAEPTSVNKLVSELIVQCGLAIWPDDVENIIRLQVLRNIATDAERFDDSNIVAQSLRVREQPEKRISQVWTFFGLKTPLLPLDDTSSYRSSARLVDLDAEENYGQPAIRKIFSRWIPAGGLTIAQRTNQIQLGRYVKAPRAFSYSLFRRGADTPELGEGCRVLGLPMQDLTGAYENVPAQITRLNPGVGLWEVEATEVLFNSAYDEGDGTPTVIFDANELNVDLLTRFEDLFPPAEHGDTVDFYVNEGVIIGSSSTGATAMTVGNWPTQAVTGNRTSGSPIVSGLSVDTATWAAVGQRVFGTGIPAGAKILTVDSSSQITLDANASSGAGTSTALTVHTVIINLYLRGRIQGKGGNGGQGGTAFNTTAGDGSPGQAGGLALYSRYGVNLFLDVGDAEVFGGGGGGGGASVWFYSLGDGGGGGAGSVPGSGGAIGGTAVGEQPGAPGTTEAGGSGGHNTGYGGSNPHGGNGGGPGIAGASGTTFGSGYDGGAGGAAGGAIDGVSYLVKTGVGDIRGTQVN
jgi:hypothetical protein